MQSVLTRSDRLVPMLHANFVSAASELFCAAHTHRPKRAQIIFYCAFPVELPHFEPRDDIRNFTCFPTCPFVAHGTVLDRVISTLKSWSVSSCRVSFNLVTTNCVVPQSCLFPRVVVPCLASPRHLVFNRHVGGSTRKNSAQTS